jgi:hypothetical protein
MTFAETTDVGPRRPPRVFHDCAGFVRTLAVGATEPERFENPGGFVHFEDVTRDGRYLVLKAPAVPPMIWLQRVGVPSERRALVQGQFRATQARVSPDGRWLAFTLELPRGLEVFVQPFDRPGDRIQISRTGGTDPIWRADSRELYYDGTDGLMAVVMTERGARSTSARRTSLCTLRATCPINFTTSRLRRAGRSFWSTRL